MNQQSSIRCDRFRPDVTKSHSATHTAAAMAVLLLLLVPAAITEAGSIVFTNKALDLTGGGFGNVEQILVLQQQGSATTEFGSVTRSAGSDVTSDDATPQAQTISVADLAAKGIVSSATFGLVFNISEANNETDLVLHDFSMTFTDDTGTLLFADVSYTAPVGGITLDQVAGGQGGSGWLFQVNLDPADEATLFAAATNRIGMIITSANAIEMVSGGAESFHVFRVPEPSTLLLVAAGLFLVPLRKRRERTFVS